MRQLTADDIEQRRARAEIKREDQAARQQAKLDAAAAREDEHRRRRAQKLEDRRQAWQARAQRRTEWAASLAVLGRRLRPVAPLLLVTGFAMYAQYDYGFGAYTSPETGWAAKLVVALGAAIAVESIANYVQWHAHDALLLGATSTAARLRRASYLIALVIAGVNYSHFSDGWAPTPAAVVFALFSAAQPWLWGLHTRRAQRIQLIREGQVDSTGAVFSAERWRAFPWDTWQARRWSIDHGVDDPRAAWAGYKADEAERQAEKKGAQSSEEPHFVEVEAPGPDQLAIRVPVRVNHQNSLTSLYRLWDEAGTLLYVGITIDMTARMATHRRKREWWPEVAEITVEEYPTRSEALAAEMSAIADGAPRYNQNKGQPVDSFSFNRYLDGPEPTAADRDKIRPIALPAMDQAIMADLREWAVDRAAIGADRPSRDDMIEAYGIGATRARKIRNLLAWNDTVPADPTGADREPTGAAR